MYSIDDFKLARPFPTTATLCLPYPLSDDHLTIACQLASLERRTGTGPLIIKEGKELEFPGDQQSLVDICDLLFAERMIIEYRSVGAYLFFDEDETFVAAGLENELVDEFFEGYRKLGKNEFVSEMKEYTFEEADLVHIFESVSSLGTVKANAPN